MRGRQIELSFPEGIDLIDDVVAMIAARMELERDRVGSFMIDILSNLLSLIVVLH